MVMSVCFDNLNLLGNICVPSLVTEVTISPYIELKVLLIYVSHHNIFTDMLPHNINDRVHPDFIHFGKVSLVPQIGSPTFTFFELLTTKAQKAHSKFNIETSTSILKSDIFNLEKHQI
jgi:hypothetical protein